MVKGHFARGVVNLKGRRLSRQHHDGGLCARVLTHLSLNLQTRVLDGMAALSYSIVPIDRQLNSPYQRWRQRLKRTLGFRDIRSRRPISKQQITAPVREAGTRDVALHRLLPLNSETAHIGAERDNAASMRPRFVRARVLTS